MNQMQKQPNQMFADYQYDPEAQALERRQRVLDALQNQTLAPIQAPAPGQSGPFQVASKINPMQGMAQLAQAYLGRKQNEDLTKEKEVFQKRSVEQLREELQNYFGKTQADPQGALLEALSSNHPMMRSLAMAQLEAQMKQGGRKLMQADPGKTLIDESTGEVVLPRAPQGLPPGVIPGISEDGLSGPGWKMIPDGRGGMARVTALGLDPYDKAAKTNTSMNVSLSPVIKGEGKFMEEIGGETGKAVIAARNAKVSGQQRLVMADRMEKLINDGTFNNVPANIAVVTSSLANVFNDNAVKKELANSEEFKSLISKEAAAALTGPGGAKFTDKDMELFLGQFPALTNSEAGKRAIINATKRAAQRDINYANAVEKRLRSDPKYTEAASLFDLSPSLEDFPAEGPELPETPAPTKKRYNPATGRIE
jgi:hypothetical protein